MLYCVYLLVSDKDERYYYGFSTDPSKRLIAHNAGKVTSTRPRRPLRLLGYKTFDNSRDARYYEFQLKKHSDKKKAFIQEILKMGL